MPENEPFSNIPLAEALGAANGLVSAKLIEDWALGGALAAIYYVEPFTTFEMRQKLAREPFEEKFRKVGQLIRLAKSFPRRLSRPIPARPSPNLTD
jgi:hypothetical protein